MARSLKLQIVARARALIADEGHWCRGDLARDAKGMGVCPMSDEAVKRCGLGALIMAAYQITNDYRVAYDLAIKPMRPLHGSPTLVNVNDVRGHHAVLALLDEVIAAGYVTLSYRCAETLPLTRRRSACLQRLTRRFSLSGWVRTGSLIWASQLRSQVLGSGR